MKLVWYNLIFLLLIGLLCSFIIFNAVTYTEFKGKIGAGSTIGLAFTPDSIIVFILLLINVPLYFAVKRKMKASK